MSSGFPLRLALAALCLGATLTRSEALQLGETEAQIVARHGTAAFTDHGKNLAAYYWSGWSARLEFQGGVVQRLTYRKDELLSGADIASLLQANGGAAQWNEATPAGAKVRQWVRKDGAMAKMEALKTTMITFEGGRVPTVPPPKLTAQPLENAISDSFARQAAAPAPAVLARAEPEIHFLSTSVPATKAAAMPKLREIEATPEEAALQVPDPQAMRRLLSVKERLTSPISPDAAAVQATGASLLSGLVPRLFFAACLFAVLMVITALARVYLAKVIRAFLDRRAPQIAGLGDVAAASSPQADAAVAESAGIKQTSGLADLRWDQFELLVGELYRREGYAVELSAALGADGGIDLTLRRDAETILVQCKHWKTASVAAREMREFYGAMAASGAPRGIFVTTGKFSRDAREFAEGKGIELVDRPILEERMAALARPGEDWYAVETWVAGFAEKARVFDPECPACRGSMALRRNRTTSEPFWGCANYPRCSGTREPRLDLIPMNAPPAPTAVQARAA